MTTPHDFELWSPLTPEECARRVRNALGLGAYPLPTVPSEFRHVAGVMDAAGCTLRAGGRLYEIPDLVARFLPDGGGTRVACGYRPNAGRWLLRGLYAVLVAISLYYARLALTGQPVPLRTGGARSAWGLAIASIAGIALVVLAIWRERRLCPRFLAQARGFLAWAVEARDGPAGGEAGG